MLETEFQFYKEHQNELLKQYEGKHLLIVGQSVVGAFDNDLEAYLAGKKDYGAGGFLVQHCTPGEESYKKRFHARVVFKNPHAA